MRQSTGTAGGVYKVHRVLPNWVQAEMQLMSGSRYLGGTWLGIPALSILSSRSLPHLSAGSCCVSLKCGVHDGWVISSHHADAITLYY